jgi:uncharacterized protein (TIRG00374 family)
MDGPCRAVAWRWGKSQAVLDDVVLVAGSNVTEDPVLLVRPASWRVPSFAIAAALAVILLYYSLRGVDWAGVAAILAGAQAKYVALAAVLGSVSLLLRSCRWRVLLSAEGPVSVPSAFWATSAGSLGNNLLPARAGELIRAYMVSSRSSLNSAFALTTALAERVAEAIVLVAVCATALLLLPAQPVWLVGRVAPFALAVAVGVIAIAILPLFGPVGAATIARLPLPGGFGARLVKTFDHVLRALRAFHDVRRLVKFGGFIAAIWCMDLGTMMLTGAAVGLQIRPAVAALLVAGLAVGSALPSTPGYIGTYQFIAVVVLTPFGFSRTDAIAFIILVQVQMYVVIGCWGAIGFVRHRRARRFAQAASATDPA